MILSASCTNDFPHSGDQSAFAPAAFPVPSWAFPRLEAKSREDSNTYFSPALTTCK